jgi:ABC-type multidrug transport system fused ATPase/permease subunit
MENILSKSSPTKIISLLNENNYTFNTNSYRQELLDGIIKKTDWDHILTESGKVLSLSWEKKKSSDMINLPSWIFVLAVICIILSFIYGVVIYVAAISYSDGTFLITISIICISVSTLMSAVLATYNFRRKLRNYKNLYEIMQEDLDNYLVNVNLKYKNMLNWVYIPHNKSMECNILDTRNIKFNVEEGNILNTNKNSLHPQIAKKENGRIK